MPKIKLTKSELKSQRDALKQFQRFLPTLQLKKQQLQMEWMKCQDRVKANEEREREIKSHAASWLPLFGEQEEVTRLAAAITVEGIETGRQNIAGVDIPLYKRTLVKIADYDLFTTDPWIDDAVKLIVELLENKAERTVLEEQRRCIERELRVTTQRVNLFEKVKIPECKDNIRIIQIYLGDQQTASVGRSKIAKRKMSEAA